MQPMDQNGMGEGYEKTKPWHPLYNIICFSIFGYLYLMGLEQPTIQNAIYGLEYVLYLMFLDG